MTDNILDLFGRHDQSSDTFQSDNVYLTSIFKSNEDG